MNWQCYADSVRLNRRVAKLFLAGLRMTRFDVARSYDGLAADYDGAWLVHLRATTDRLLDRLPAELPEGTLVDLGCGTGYVARRLCTRYPRRTVEACDISAGMIAEARALPGGERAAWHFADMRDFLARQPSASAALVVAAWSVGYTDYRRVFRACARVLASGGCLACVVNLADTLAPLRRAFRYCMQAHAGELRCLPRFKFPRNTAALRRALRHAGFAMADLEEGYCPIDAPAAQDGRRLPWLLRTGTLAGFDAMLPLDAAGPVAATFEARLAADPAPLLHHYVLAVAVHP